jgi:hypothetical protein
MGLSRGEYSFDHCTGADCIRGPEVRASLADARFFNLDYADLVRKRPNYGRIR